MDVSDSIKFYSKFFFHFFVLLFPVDLSLYTSESQLERASDEISTPKSSKKVTGNKKSTIKKLSKKRFRDESDEEDSDDSDYVVLAKTAKMSVRDVSP